MARLVVIVAARDAGSTVLPCLYALKPQIEALGAQLLVVAPHASVEAYYATPLAHVLEVAGDPLVPNLWRAGILATSSELVALTIAQCEPAPNWLELLMEALDEGSVAAAGPIDCDSDKPENAAVFYLRYSTYLTPFPRHDAEDIPGDNAIYRRAAIEAAAASWQHGFWENEVNAALRKAGKRLVMDPRPVVRLRTGGGPYAFMRQRFRHGVVFGRWQASQGASKLRVLAAPIVPFVFLRRVIRRVRSKPAHQGTRGGLVAALPYLAGYLAAWTAGETVGLLRGPRK